jgi:glycosyltransferase involved in cell wall biosynthesis
MSNKLKISFAITCHNELEELKRLIPFLLVFKEEQDEIVVLYDTTNGTEDVLSFLGTYEHKIHVTGDSFEGNFADWKNKLTSYCGGDYIINIDADEMPHEILMNNIHVILEENPVDVVLVPRVNTVEGLTDAHIQKWGWQVNEHGWVNWPDYQMRVYRNDESIRWQNKVHETLIGHTTISNLPLMEELALYHPKTIDRQEKQNAYYNTL